MNIPIIVHDVKRVFSRRWKMLFLDITDKTIRILTNLHRLVKDDLAVGVDKLYVQEDWNIPYCPTDRIVLRGSIDSGNETK